MDYNWSKKRKYLASEGDVKDQEPEKIVKKKKDIWNGGTDSPDLVVVKNHIYFYCGVTKKSCLKLNTELKKVSNNLLKEGSTFIKKDKYIYLHINSYGGSVFAAFSVIDTIKNLSIPVVSIIEGAAASAATMISTVCDYRIIHPTGFMLIHELSSSTWGKMHEMEDEMKNLDRLMKEIKSIYKKHTEIEPDDLDEILKHDIWWDSKKCLKVGLVDEIFKGKKIYKFNRDNLSLKN